MKLIHGDCLKEMFDIPDNSVDMVCCDMPYGTTACKWDTVLPLDMLWYHYNRICKDNAAIVLNASQPFTTTLIDSNLKWFKYCWVWEKSRATGHVHSKNKPMKKHEDICVFSDGTTVHKSQSKNRMVYNPQGLKKVDKLSYRPSRGVSGSDVVSSLRPSHKKTIKVEFENYPNTILKINSEHNVGAFHPTQKPVALIEYLIKTYTDEGDTVLDNCMGSGTTGVACKNLNRDFIGIELDEKYFEIAKKRIESAQVQLTMAI